jgi:hypothetical protein
MQLDLQSVARVQQAREQGIKLAEATDFFTYKSQDHTQIAAAFKSAVEGLADIQERLIEAARKGEKAVPVALVGVAESWRFPFNVLELDEYEGSVTPKTGTRDDLKLEPHRLIWDKLIEVDLSPTILRIDDKYYIGIKVP